MSAIKLKARTTKVEERRGIVGKKRERGGVFEVFSWLSKAKEEEGDFKRRESGVK